MALRAMPQGYLAFVLHAHLPFVRHPEHARHLEERWLYEAFIECYLPLLDAFDRMAEEGVPFALTMSIDVTMKGRGRSAMTELCVYRVKNGKIISEEFAM